MAIVDGPRRVLARHGNAEGDYATRQHTLASWQDGGNGRLARHAHSHQHRRLRNRVSFGRSDGRSLAPSRKPGSTLQAGAEERCLLACQKFGWMHLISTAEA